PASWSANRNGWQRSSSGAAGCTCSTRRVAGPSSGQHDPQPLPAADSGCRRQFRGFVVYVPFGPAVEHLVQSDTALQPGEVGSETVMHAFPKGDVRDVVTMDVERVRIGVPAGGAIGGTE